MDHPVGRALEWLFERVAHVHYLSEGSLYRYAVHPHKGGAVTFEGGAAVRRGDAVLELHLDNEITRRIAQESGGTGRRFAAAFLRAGRAGLAEVARLVDTELPEVRAVFANTPRRFVRIAQGLGYEIRELDSALSARVIGRMQRGVLKRFDPDAHARIPSGSPELIPVEAWMSRELLLERYLTAEEWRAPGHAPYNGPEVPPGEATPSRGGYGGERSGGEPGPEH